MVSMNGRVVVFLFLVISCWSCNARDLTVTANHISDQSAISTALQDDKLAMVEAQQVIKNEKLCTLCEKFTSDALKYLLDNKTQAEIIDFLHKSCSQVASVYKQQCTTLVDYYAPLFFLEASKVQTEDFCRKFGLCEKAVSIYQHVSKDKCDVCHDFITEALIKLKDPDTELEIVQLLLKACNSIGKTAKKCKRLVFEYAPIILVNAEQFLETNDVCGILRVCVSSADDLKLETAMHAES